jgi:hypothetical protein
MNFFYFLNNNNYLINRKSIFPVKKKERKKVINILIIGREIKIFLFFTVSIFALTRSACCRRSATRSARSSTCYTAVLVNIMRISIIFKIPKPISTATVGENFTHRII